MNKLINKYIYYLNNTYQSKIFIIKFNHNHSAKMSIRQSVPSSLLHSSTRGPPT